MSDPIIMVLRQAAEGVDVAAAEYAGRSYEAHSRNGATRKLARMLVRGGAPDVRGEVRGTNGRLRYSAKSLHALSGSTIEDSDTGGLRLRRYQERSDFPARKPQDAVSDTGQPEHAPDQKAA